MREGVNGELYRSQNQNRNNPTTANKYNDDDYDIVYPPGNRTNWDDTIVEGEEGKSTFQISSSLVQLWEYVRSIAHVPTTWRPNQW